MIGTLPEPLSNHLLSAPSVLRAAEPHLNKLVSQQHISRRWIQIIFSAHPILLLKHGYHCDIAAGRCQESVGAPVPRCV